MECRNHQNTEAVDKCIVCGEPFCFNCLVSVQGKKYCSSCKSTAVKGERVEEILTRRCGDANAAFSSAVLGVCLSRFATAIPLVGWLLGILLFFIFIPAAISKAIKAKAQVSQDPSLEGRGTANGALIISIGYIAFIAVSLISIVRR